MLIATNKTNEQILADKTLCKTNIYYCPSCQNRVHLKAGSTIRPHFAHYKKEACAAFSEGETEEHLLGKQQLYDWLVGLGHSVEMEAYLPELMQRPDLLLEGKIAIEFQCSGLSIEKIKERTKGYLNNGYKVVWILGEQFTYRRKLTAFQKACLTKIQNQLVLFHYSVTHKRLEYRYNFQRQQNDKMQQVSHFIKKDHLPIFNLMTQKDYIPKTLNIIREHRKLLKQFQYPTPTQQQFLSLLYQNRETVISMPKEIYRKVPSEWLIQDDAYEWKFRFLLWVESFDRETIITHEELQAWLKQLTYYEIPQMTDKQKLQPLLEFIQILTQSGVLNPIKPHKWFFKEIARRYTHLEEKFK